MLRTTSTRSGWLELHEATPVHIGLHEVAMARNSASSKKLLRAISGIGGVSDRTLSSVLAFARDHPEVLECNLRQESVCSCMSAYGGGDRFSCADASHACMHGGVDRRNAQHCSPTGP